jgi:membrane-associated phospholipid phosphatase
MFPLDHYAQSPYEMNWKKDGALIVVGVPLAAVGITLDRSVTPLTLDEVDNLNRDDIFLPDRFVTSNYSPDASHLSDILLYTCMLSPTLLLISKPIRNDIPVIAGMYLQSLILGVAFPAFSKGGFQRIRPYAYNPDVPMEIKLRSETKRSFFSGHTTVSFASTVFLSSVYSRYYPDSNAKPYIWTGSLLLASTVGYLRVAAGSHFLSDVLVGAIIGSAIGYFIPKIHETDETSPEQLMPDNSARVPLIAFQFAL